VKKKGKETELLHVYTTKEMKENKQIRLVFRRMEQPVLIS